MSDGRPASNNDHKSEDKTERFERVFEEYSGLLMFDKYEKKDDLDLYDMYQRLSLADMVSRDGHKLVADLGSQDGGMTYALKRIGIENVISVEFDKYYADKIKKSGINYEVLCYDAFLLSEQGISVDAAVSYMFLGINLPRQLSKDRKIKDVFDMLFRTTDTIYSVELQSEYSFWFNKKSLEPAEIEKRLKECMPDVEIEYLGEFGMYHESTDYDEYSDRIGFKLTKKNIDRCVK